MHPGRGKTLLKTLLDSSPLKTRPSYLFVSGAQRLISLARLMCVRQALGATRVAPTEGCSPREGKFTPKDRSSCLDRYAYKHKTAQY